MATPAYIGDTTWQEQPGRSVGADSDGRVRISIPYAGDAAGVGAFRALWKKGAACPIDQFSAYLTEAPVITEGEGGRCTATLVFEGADLSGTFGDPAEVHERQFVETKEIRLQGVAGESGLNGEPDSTAIYIYNAPVAIISYIDTTRHTVPQKTPSPQLVTPEVQAMQSANDIAFAKDPAYVNLNAGTLLNAVTVSGFLDIETIGSAGNKAYAYEEFHTILLEPVEPV